MKLIADLHIHSHYSRATSKNLDFENLDRWAQIKGVHIVGTGDIAHPGWLPEMRDMLEPAEHGPVPTAARNSPMPSGTDGRVPSWRGALPAGRRDQQHLQTPRRHAQGAQRHLRAQSGRRCGSCKPRWNASATSAPTAAPSWASTRATCWRSCWRWTPAATSSPPTSGRRGSRCSAPSRASTRVEECFDDLTRHIFAAGDRPLVRPAHELARVRPRPLHAGLQLRRALAAEAGPRGHPLHPSAATTPSSTPCTPATRTASAARSSSSPKRASITWTAIASATSTGSRPRRSRTAALCRCAASRSPWASCTAWRSWPTVRPAASPRAAHPFASLIPLPEILGEVHGVGPNTRTVERAVLRAAGCAGPGTRHSAGCAAGRDRSRGRGSHRRRHWPHAAR